MSSAPSETNVRVEFLLPLELTLNINGISIAHPLNGFKVNGFTFTMPMVEGRTGDDVKTGVIGEVWRVFGITLERVDMVCAQSIEKVDSDAVFGGSGDITVIVGNTDGIGEREVVRYFLNAI